MFVLLWPNLTKKKYSFIGKAVRIALYCSAVLFVAIVMRYVFLPPVGYRYLIMGFSIAVFGILQAKLSKKENETFGLILPTISFVSAILILLYSGILNDTTKSFAVYICQVAFCLLGLNVPTIVFLAIFFACRKNSKAIKELNKMNIMDLE